jgi:hypothetical protein
MTDPHRGRTIRHLTIAQYTRLRRNAEAARAHSRLKHPIRTGRGAVRSVMRALGVAAILPPAFDPMDASNRRLTTPVRQQPSHSESCTAYAVAAAMEGFWCRQQQRPEALPFLSVDEIFDAAGAELDAAIGVASSTPGISDEVCHPPNGVRCSQWAQSSWRGDFTLMDQPLREMVDAMRESLVASGPVVIAMPIFPNFDAFTGSGVYAPGGGAVIGAHALAVIGYETLNSGGVWVAKNSYGAGWGDQGYVRLAWRDKKLEPEAVAYATLDVHHPA